MSENKTITELVRRVIERERVENRTYPNYIGGREIDRMFGHPLTLDEWTEFHKVYNKLRNPWTHKLVSESPGVLERRSCQTCIYLKRRKGGLGTEPYCSIGVTNRRDDPNRKDGKCTKWTGGEN